MTPKLALPWRTHTIQSISTYRTGHGKTSIFGGKKSNKLFGGKKGKFALAAGAGFVGGAAAGIAGMEAYHRYKQYKAMMHYKVTYI